MRYYFAIMNSLQSDYLFILCEHKKFAMLSTFFYVKLYFLSLVKSVGTFIMMVHTVTSVWIINIY